MKLGGRLQSFMGDEKRDEAWRAMRERERERERRKGVGPMSDEVFLMFLSLFR